MQLNDFQTVGHFDKNRSIAVVVAAAACIRLFDDKVDLDIFGASGKFIADHFHARFKDGLFGIAITNPSPFANEDVGGSQQVVPRFDNATLIRLGLQKGQWNSFAKLLPFVERKEHAIAHFAHSWCHV